MSNCSVHVMPGLLFSGPELASVKREAGVRNQIIEMGEKWKEREGEI